MPNARNAQAVYDGSIAPGPQFERTTTDHQLQQERLEVLEVCERVGKRTHGLSMD